MTTIALEKFVENTDVCLQATYDGNRRVFRHFFVESFVCGRRWCGQVSEVLELESCRNMNSDSGSRKATTNS